MSADDLVGRREFLKVSFVTGVGIIISAALPGCGGSAPGTTPMAGITPTAATAPTAESPAWLTPNLYLKIGNDGTVTVTVTRSEMGQGVRTALPMIAAEELGADWTTVRVEQAPGDSSYGNQITGGSTSIQDCYLLLRKAGAVARELLVGAAAATWAVEKSTCTVQNGSVVHTPTGREIPFSQLVTAAAKLPVPRTSDVALKGSKDFQILGKPVPRIDGLDIVTGRAIFGMDVHIPDMLFAVVASCPVPGGTAVQVRAEKAKAVPGVREVVAIDRGIAVIADDTWAAIQGRNALEVTWDEGDNASFDSLQAEKDALTLGSHGAENGTLEKAYVVPFFAHATMEPMNCVADVRPDRCEIWVPTQNPQGVRHKASAITGLPEKAIKVNVTLLGGGFGRRLETGLGGGSPPATVDYVAQAVQVSKAVGAPIKLTWTRQDDFMHDMYHPLSVSWVSAGLDDIRSLHVSTSLSSGGIPVGNWRAVSNVAAAFAHECYVDEFAQATKTDPIDLRRQLLPKSSQAVLDLAATKARWGSPMPSGQGRGVAFHSAWNVTPVAMVAEVEVSGDGQVHVLRVVCAVDCGTVINPDLVVAQMEGGIAFGLSAALKNAITISKGRTQQVDFQDYPLLRIDEMPPVEVYIIPSEEPPSGVGEMANPVIAPAVANAVFAATGKRVRRLPIRPEDLRQG
jgi:isoquinoline 1-oxidoreductase beta subunit